MPTFRLPKSSVVRPGILHRAVKHDSRGEDSVAGAC